MFGVAKKVAIEALREQGKEGRVLTCLPQVQTSHGCAYEESLFERLEAGLLKLPPDSRGLLISYFATGDDKNMRLRRELAQREGISLNALRIRVHRLKSLLEAYIAADLETETQSDSTPAIVTVAQPARRGATLYAI
jgi:DNA-directed RNA polymerase specialized sigma24 family protein